MLVSSTEVFSHNLSLSCSTLNPERKVRHRTKIIAKYSVQDQAYQWTNKITSLKDDNVVKGRQTCHLVRYSLIPFAVNYNPSYSHEHVVVNTAYQ